MAGGQPQQGFSGPVELGDTTAGNSRNAIIDIVQGNQYTSPITVRAGSSGTLALMSEASLTLNGPLVLNNNLTLSAPGSNTLSHYGVISGSGGLRIGNPLAFVVFGANKSLVNAGSV